MNQSKELTTFYKAMHEWINAGFPESEVFKGYYGLCNNLVKFCEDMDHSDYVLQQEMEHQFIDAGLDQYVPFNNIGGMPSFFKEVHHYKNPLRINWIREHAKEQS